MYTLLPLVSCKPPEQGYVPPADPPVLGLGTPRVGKRGIGIRPIITVVFHYILWHTFGWTCGLRFFSVLSHNSA